MKLTPKQRCLLDFLHLQPTALYLHQITAHFGDTQRSIYGKRLKALAKKGLVTQLFYKGPWRLS